MRMVVQALSPNSGIIFQADLLYALNRLSCQTLPNEHNGNNHKEPDRQYANESRQSPSGKNRLQPPVKRKEQSGQRQGPDNRAQKRVEKAKAEVDANRRRRD